MLKKFTLLIAVLAALSLVSACGGGNNNAAASATQTAANGDEFNDADVTFATEMVQHHAQALSMVDMTMGRQLDPEVKQLAEEIRTAQAPEIEQMTGWLTDWDQPIPATMRDHANADKGGQMDMNTDMPGMMSGEEMAQLEQATGEEFQQMWLEMMVKHHQGAVEMAQTEQSDGTHPDSIKLAASIESSQKKEISTMEGLLGS